MENVFFQYLQYEHTIGLGDTYSLYMYRSEIKLYKGSTPSRKGETIANKLIQPGDFLSICMKEIPSPPQNDLSVPTHHNLK